LALVAPGQILMGSDAPYTTPAHGAMMAMRHALQVGLDDDQVRSVMGAQAARLLARDEPLDVGPPPGPDRISRDPVLERVYSYLLNAGGQMLNGLDARETIALAKLACEVGDDAPQAQACRVILALIDEQSRLAPDGDHGHPRRITPGVWLIIVAAALARTPDVALPPAPSGADVAERFRGDPSG
jgi:hypothetical protein